MSARDALLRLAALAGAALAFAAAAAPPADFDARVAGALATSGAPGATVAIVEGDTAVLARGYGLRRLGAPDKVDADTLFQIGSTTKAFTAAALAVLVEEGKLGWDDRVIDHLPDFRMHDAWVTREITVRDLLVHRSGLGRGQGDLLLIPSTHFSRDEIVRRLRFLEPPASFRAGFAYDNLLYIVAGQVVEAAGRQPWEEFVQERLFAPLGMQGAVARDADRLMRANRAYPHGRLGELRGVGEQQPFDEARVAFGDNVGPAGAIAAGARDLTRWLAAQLAAGRIPGSEQRLFSEAASREMFQPVVPLPVTPLPPPLADAMPQFRGYALGWIVQDYRGHKVIQHGGGTQGFRAIVALLPEKNVGWAIANNSEDNEFAIGLHYALLDHYLGLPERDWVKAFKDVFDARNAAGLEAQRKAAAERPATQPSRPLAAYAGDYEDAWYGRIHIREEAGALVIDFPQARGMSGPLEHWAYDTFVARWTDPLIEPAYVTFALDEAGKPREIRMKAFSPVADFSFDYHDLKFVPVAP